MKKLFTKRSWVTSFYSKTGIQLNINDSDDDVEMTYSLRKRGAVPEQKWKK
ncbi:hypothetical protein MAR_003780 [Mya arenaria]|uniref:Uncharacterized protein n=1 Tax=Mya arenaria TaxID=6604 RepID=A0ABY7G8H6_MYAAR|nr:hypothetical protein MAR_003780 [Mya arenaria]